MDIDALLGLVASWRSLVFRTSSHTESRLTSWSEIGKSVSGSTLEKNGVDGEGGGVDGGAIGDNDEGGSRGHGEGHWGRQ